MRYLLTTFLLLLCTWCSATDYYFATAGNDAAAGTSTGTPWQTIAKFNTVFSTRVPGDRLLFNRGDTFYGILKPSRSGVAGNPITIGAYGTGANPVITGLTSVVAWTNLGGNIWQSTFAVTTSNVLNMVLVNGVDIPMGRTPNTGYYTYQTSTQTTKTSTSINSAVTNWKGAIAVIRLNNWIVDNDTVLAHSGTTFTHSYHNVNAYLGIPNYGFFFQNDVRTLDTQNEWYFDSTKRLKMYSVGIPSGVQVPSIDTLVFMLHRSYITFDSVSFLGSNKMAFCLNANPNTTIQNYSIDYSGMDAIWGGQNWGSPFAPNFVLKDGVINHTHNTAINIQSEFRNALIQGNLIKNTALVMGMGKPGEGTYITVNAYDSNAVIEYNIIDSSGYVPIYWFANNQTIRYNLIMHYNRTKMDGGGIYSWHGNGPDHKNIKIYNNIIIDADGLTALPGTTELIPLVHGIYLDANTKNVEAYSNTCANLAYGGAYFYSGASFNNLHDNTFYNNGYNQILMKNYFSNGQQTKTDTLTNNLFISKTATQYTIQVTTLNGLPTYTSAMGLFRNNFYARPIDDNTTIRVVSNNSTTFSNYTVMGWQVVSVNDVGSAKSPKTITGVSSIRFEYNATKFPVTVTLDSIYIDMRGTTYPGSITLAPYTSAVLIANGALTTPPLILPTYWIRKQKTTSL